MTKAFLSPAETLAPLDLPLGPADSSPELALPDGPLFARRSILPGGIRLITQFLPGTRAASVGLWVTTGSRDEEPEQAGASHFLEHLLFKGTRRRSAFDIARAFDAVGADSNAATSKETTHYYAKVLDQDLPLAISVLADMVTDSLLSAADVETERTVIIDELAMSEDSPGEVAHENFLSAVFGDTPLGRPVGGTVRSVSQTSPAAIRDLYQRRYGPDSLVVAVAGNVEHEAVRDLLLAALADSWPLAEDADPRPRRAATADLPLDPGESTIGRDVEQAHILVGVRWLPAADDRRPVSTVLTTVLGGGMSSRLFQEIRERRGLGYSTYAFDSAYADSGVFGMYAGSAPRNVAEVERLMWGEVEKLADGDLAEAELAQAKGQLRGGLALGLEDSASRMGRLARSEITGRFVSVDAGLARIDAVTADEVAGMARQILEQPRAKSVVTNGD